jgi:hypothetical protein
MGNGNLPAIREDLGLVSQEMLTAMLTMADRIVKSGLAPKGIDTADKALVVILQGRELGMGVMQSLQDMYVVQGKIGMMTGSMAARYLDAGHRYFVLEKSAERCVVKFVLNGGQEYVETITYQEAHDAHWDQQWNKEKSAWEPKATWAGRGRATMLLNRTLSAGIRTIAPGVLRGARSVDEVTDPGYEPETPSDVGGKVIEGEGHPVAERTDATGLEPPWMAFGAYYDDWTLKPAERDLFAKFREEYGLSDVDAKRLAGQALDTVPLAYFRDFPGDRLRLQAAILYELDSEVEDAAAKIEATEGEPE